MLDTSYTTSTQTPVPKSFYSLYLTTGCRYEWSPKNNTQIYSNIYPTRCNFTQFIYIWKRLYMIWVVLPPIIRSAYNCIYSIWYLSQSYCYPPAIVEELELPDRNELCKVASCWIYIGIYLQCTNP